MWRWRYAASGGSRPRVRFPARRVKPKGMTTDSIIAFAQRVHEPPGLEVRVNFGVFAGREATPAEIDELAEALRQEAVDGVAIVAEERHEFSDHSEASLHQVRVEIASEALPEDEDERSALEERLVQKAEAWALACIAERHAEVTEA